MRVCEKTRERERERERERRVLPVPVADFDVYQVINQSDGVLRELSNVHTLRKKENKLKLWRVRSKTEEPDQENVLTSDPGNNGTGSPLQSNPHVSGCQYHGERFPVESKH